MGQGRTPSNFRKQDIVRAVAAAQDRGLVISRVEVDPKTSKIALVIRDAESRESENPFANAPVSDPTLKRRKPKTP
jgi:hypothetical protein